MALDNNNNRSGMICLLSSKWVS